MEALQRSLSLPLSLFTIILWIIIYNLCKRWGKKNTLERRVTFSELPYGVNVPEVHLGEASSGRVGGMKQSPERQRTATEVRPKLAS